MPKRHSILPTRTGFFISNAGEIENVQAEIQKRVFQAAVSLRVTVI